MKVTITYLPAEEREARIAKAFIRELCDNVRCKERDTHPPYKHIYLATKKPGKCTDTEGNH